MRRQLGALTSSWAIAPPSTPPCSREPPRLRDRERKHASHPSRYRGQQNSPLNGLLFPILAWIPERSASGLREADWNVLSTLGNQGLEWRLEPEAFARREVHREDDLLDVLVGCPVDIQLARQPST